MTSTPEDIAARTAQELVAHTAALNEDRVEEALTKALQKVFGESDSSRDPEEMKILVRRIPIICTQIENIHDNIKDLRENITWATRIVVAAVILAVLGLAFKGGI